MHEVEEDDSFLLASIEGISGPHHLSSRTTSSSSSPTSISTSANNAIENHRDFTSSSTKRKRLLGEEEGEAAEETDERRSNKKGKEKTSKAAKTKANSNNVEQKKGKEEKKKRTKKTAPEEDLLVLIDDHLVNEKGGTEYTSVCQRPDKDKPPVQYEVRALPIRNSIEWRTSFGVDDDDDGDDDGDDDDQEQDYTRRVRRRREVGQVLVRYSGAEFGRLVRDRGLRDEVRKIRAVHGDKVLTIVIEGLHSFLAQETRRTNRARKDGASRENENDGDTSSESYSDGSDEETTRCRGGRTNNGKTGDGAGRRVTPSLVDEAVVWLQIEAKCHVRRTDGPPESAGYMYRLTSAIANAPYRQESSFATFCAEATGKRSARTSTPQETWIRQLQQINKVSVGVAMAIADKYPTFRSLMSAYQNDSLKEQDKELLLQDIKVGSATTSKDRRVGPALSKRIYLVFTDEDGSQKVN